MKPVYKAVVKVGALMVLLSSVYVIDLLAKLIVNGSRSLYVVAFAVLFIPVLAMIQLLMRANVNPRTYLVAIAVLALWSGLTYALTAVAGISHDSLWGIAILVLLVFTVTALDRNLRTDK